MRMDIRDAFAFEQFADFIIRLSGQREGCIAKHAIGVECTERHGTTFKYRRRFIDKFSSHAGGPANIYRIR